MSTLLEQAKERRNLKHAEIGQILDTAGNEERGLLASENRQITKLTADRAALDERIAQLQEYEKREAASAAVRKMVGMANTSAPNCSPPIPALRLMLAETIGQTARAISATLLVLALVTTWAYPDLSIPCRSLSENMGLRPLRLGTTDHQKVAGSGSNLP